MGGKLSPSLANIFVHMLEKDVIEKLIMSGDIVSYHRYVNDIFCVVKKGVKNNVLNEMNKFDPMLKFTLENMTDDKLNFLDTTECFEDKELKLKQYRKPESTDCLINFKKGVSPKSYKIPFYYYN